MPSSPATTARSPREAWGLETPNLGLSLGGTHGPDQARAHLGWVELAESVELHSIWLPEMHFQPGVCPAPLLELAGYAATTRRLRLGTTSLLLPLHPPEKIAAEIATLDQLSQGRLLVGLGRGFQKPMLRAFGVPPAEKRDRFDEALDRILALWAEHNGRSQCSPLQTYTRPHPPLAVAAFGPKGLAQAARRDLPYLASPVETFDQVADNQTRHRSLLPDPEKKALSLVMRTIFVSEDAGELDAARESLIGEMTGRREGMPAAVNRALDAPLESRAVIGTTEEVTERLIHERRRLDIDLLVTRPQLARVERNVTERSLVRLVEEVWPAVRADAEGRPAGSADH
ncbi:MAG: LLM class flavin-dependent oxidoreductase [bacterium]|nr:LLM class flavin-dependent oxidoreductase [bacterium]